MKKSIKYQNKKIFYRITGIGSPVMFVHGFGEHGNVFKNQVEYLKDKFQLIVPDLPGSGQSELIEDMSMEGMAEVLHSIIHEENIDRCPVIGHSMGGYITLALMDSYPNHVSALGLFHSTTFADTEEKKETRRKGIEQTKQYGAMSFIKTVIPNLFSQETKDGRSELVDEQIASLHNFSGEALVSYYQAMIQRPDRTDLLRNTTSPVLFIMGKYDKAVSPEDALKQSHIPEKSYIHLLQHSAHMGMLEEPVICNVAIENFLLDVPTQS